MAPFMRGQQYSMIAALSKKGYLAAHVIPGSIDSFGFFDFIVEDVVRSLFFWDLSAFFICLPVDLEDKSIS